MLQVVITCAHCGRAKVKQVTSPSKAKLSVTQLMDLNETQHHPSERFWNVVRDINAILCPDCAKKLLALQGQQKEELVNFGRAARSQ